MIDKNNWNNTGRRKDRLDVICNTSRVLLVGYRLCGKDKFLYDIIKIHCWDNQKGMPKGFRNDCLIERRDLITITGINTRTFDWAMTKLIRLNLIAIFHRVSYTITKNGKELTMVKAFKNDWRGAIAFRKKSKDGKTLSKIYRCYNPKGHGQKVVYTKLDGIL